MSDDLHIKGLDKLNEFLQQFPAKFERNVLRGGLRAGAVQELLPEVQANLMAAGAVKTGELISGIKVKTSARGGKVTASVVSTGKHAYIMKWIEFGVRAHDIVAKAGGWLSFLGIFAKAVHHPGFAARPCMRPALDRSGGAAVVAAGEYMKDRLERGGLDTSDITIAEGP